MEVLGLGAPMGARRRRVVVGVYVFITEPIKVHRIKFEAPNLDIIMRQLLWPRETRCGHGTRCGLRGLLMRVAALPGSDI